MKIDSVFLRNSFLIFFSVIGVAVITIALLTLRTEWPGIAKVRWSNAINSIYGIATCLEQYRAINDRYPRSLDSVSECMVNYRLSKIDPWGEPWHFENDGSTAYTLRGCTADSSCWDYLEENLLGSLPTFYGLEIESGVWKFPTGYGYPNQSLFAAFSEEEPTHLIIKVTTTILEKSELSHHPMSSQPSYSLAVRAYLLGSTQGAVQQTQDLDASFQDHVIWENDRASGSNDQQVEAKIPILHCEENNKILVEVLQMGLHERSLTDNYVLLDCPPELPL